MKISVNNLKKLVKKLKKHLLIYRIYQEASILLRQIFLHPVELKI